MPPFTGVAVRVTATNWRSFAARSAFTAPVDCIGFTRIGSGFRKRKVGQVRRVINAGLKPDAMTSRELFSRCRHHVMPPISSVVQTQLPASRITRRPEIPDISYHVSGGVSGTSYCREDDETGTICNA